jgi:hypothetical protein
MSDRDELIAKARELSAAASPGPWGIAGGYIKGADTYPVCEPWPPIDRNGRFIAESRTLLPALADLAESEGRRADEAAGRLRMVAAAYREWDEHRCMTVTTLLAIRDAIDYSGEGQQP